MKPNKVAHTNHQSSLRNLNIEAHEHTCDPKACYGPSCLNIMQHPMQAYVCEYNSNLDPGNPKCPNRQILQKSTKLENL